VGSRVGGVSCEVGSVDDAMMHWRGVTGSRGKPCKHSAEILKTREYGGQRYVATVRERRAREVACVDGDSVMGSPGQLRRHIVMRARAWWSGSRRQRMAVPPRTLSHSATTSPVSAVLSTPTFMAASSLNHVSEAPASKFTTNEQLHMVGNISRFSLILLEVTACLSASSFDRKTPSRASLLSIHTATPATRLVSMSPAMSIYDFFEPHLPDTWYHVRVQSKIMSRSWKRAPFLHITSQRAAPRARD
jgi:hypothetical protein